ncbi:MAG: radical SAM protein [Deltaproteobacteria bacterium]|nr:radical SAM protein [Deltaproteobacteria bacterium]
MTAVVYVHSIFRSIQGESTRAGLPCAFVRLAGCPLRCSYCDTRDAAEAKGVPMPVAEVAAAAAALGPRLFEVTGGEPLAQPGAPALLSALADLGFEVLLETSGAFSVAGLDPRVRIVMDVKCPGSGMSGRNLPENLGALRQGLDEVKFVIVSRADFDWAVALCNEHDLASRAALLVSPAPGLVALRDCAQWVLVSGLPLRLQPQMHKIVWGEDAEGR